MTKHSPETVKISELREIARRIQLYIQEMEDVANRLESVGIDALEVRSMPTLRLGVDNVRAGVLKMRTAYIDAIESSPDLLYSTASRPPDVVQERARNLPDPGEWAAEQGRRLRERSGQNAAPEASPTASRPAAGRPAQGKPADPPAKPPRKKPSVTEEGKGKKKAQ